MDQQLFDAPIPGQSLTGEVGAYPWEQPPQYNTVEEVLDYYLPKLSDMDSSIELYESIDEGVPITAAVDLLLTVGNMQGSHTLDVSTLAAPVLVEFMTNVSDKLGIKYKVGTEKQSTISKKQISKAMEDIGSSYMDTEVEETEEPMEDIEAAPEQGLMARREV